MRAGFELTTPGWVILAIVFTAQALKEMGIPSFGLTHTTLLFAGYQIFSGGLLLGIAVILSIFLGSLCGASQVFQLARWKGNWLLARLVGRGLVKSETVRKARRSLEGSAFIAVVSGRSIPGLMLPTSLLAGMLDIPASCFLPGVLIPLSLWVSGIVITGGTVRLIFVHISIPPTTLLYFLWPLIGLAGPGTIIHLWKRTAGPYNERIKIREDRSAEGLH